MSPADALHAVAGVVADGTGRTEPEVWVLGAASVAMTVTAAATRRLVRVVDAVVVHR
jgi:hypothetical protein